MDQLADIRWHLLKTASGSASHIPNALQGLISPNPSVQEKSYWQLDNHVVRQADLFESAYFVMPFLLAMLREHAPHGRALIYDLIFEIAHGYAPDSVLVNTFAGNEIPLKEACFQEVIKGIDIFRQDVNNPDSKVRKNVADLLELLEKA